jgi:hypothetical protein
MAVVSRLEARVVIELFVAGGLIVRRLVQVLNAIEARHPERPMVRAVQCRRA